MAIIKSIKTSEYAQIHNRALQNPNLSMKAKGMLACILSLPEDWVLHKKTLPNFFSDSKHAVSSAFNELEEQQYAIHIVGHNEKGHKVHTYFVRDIPFDRSEVDTYTAKYCGLIIDGVPIISSDIPKKTETRKSEIGKSKVGKSDTTKEIYKQINIITNIKKEDEDIPNGSPSDDLPHLDMKIESHKEEQLTPPKLSDDDLLWITNMVRDIYKGKIQKRSFDSVLKKCINNYKKGTVPNYENYLITAVENKITELELRRDREKSLLDLVPKVKHKKKRRTEMVPDWVKEQKQENEFVGQPVSHEPQQAYENEQQRIEDERKRLNDMLAKYKRE